MRIAICDDDVLELQKIKSKVEEFIVSKQHEQKITLQVFYGAYELLDYISLHDEFDVLILDIIMPVMNGIALAAEIRKSGSRCKIIFLTSSPEFAIDSYQVSAFYYLLKSHMNIELSALLNKALKDMKEENSSSVIIKQKGKLTRVQIHTIKYIEIINHTVYYHLNNNTVISCLSTITKSHDPILSDKRFIKCHKSFIVNMDYVISITSKEFMMDDNTQVPISRQILKQTKDIYLDFVFGKEMR
jgi:DNA-binding LytR/AlgR family response regulator